MVLTKLEELLYSKEIFASEEVKQYTDRKKEIHTIKGTKLSKCLVYYGGLMNTRKKNIGDNISTCPASKPGERMERRKKYHLTGCT